MRRGRWLVALGPLVAAGVLVTGAVAVAPERDPPAPVYDAACTHYTATTGSDGSDGSASQPWRTVSASLARLVPGDTLCVQPGTYSGEVSLRPPAGQPGAPITVRGLGDGADRPLLRGGFSLVDPDDWTITGLRFTNPSPANPDDRLVSLLGGTGWVFEGNEVFDGPYAGLLVGASQDFGPPVDYTIRDNAVHDTGATNLYLNPSRASTGGLVEHNLFYRSGTENVKLGWGGDQPCTGAHFRDFGIGGVTFRYNTLDDAQRGALIIAEPGGLHDVDVYGNLLTGEPDHLVRYDSVHGCLGDTVQVHDNAGGSAARFSQDFGDSPQNVAHEHGNVFPVDPQYISTGPDGFVPGNGRVQGYGRAAAG
jgi:hypothetical protein